MILKSLFDNARDNYKKRSYNKSMKRNIITHIFFSILIALLVASLIPYPFLGKQSNVSTKHVEEINSFWESEVSNLSCDETKLLLLKWQDVDNLLDNSQIYTIFDIETKSTFEIKRVGGKNHADVCPATTLDEQTITFLYENTDKCHPVFVKLNEKAYLPASFCSYSHGYNNHFCLHFEESKTDGTCMISRKHQKCVKEAKRSSLPC